MKKRYIVLGLVALEIALLPFAGTLLHKTDFYADMKALAKPQRAIHVKLPPEPGMTRYMVSANAPFVVTAEEMIGQFDINIYPSGEINGKSFGHNAQAPGELKACSLTETLEPRAVYKSDTGTIAKDGEILSKTVLVEIRYEPYYKPDLKILTENKSKTILSAQSCEKSPDKAI